MFGQRKIGCKVTVLLLIGLIAGCTPALQEFTAPLRPGQELVNLPTRPGVSVRVFLVAPATEPKGIFVIFPGGEGTLVSGRGGAKYSQFTRLFAEQGFVSAIVDVPSDHASGYGSGGTGRFRASKEHTEDITKVIDFVSQRWPKPISLIGHSAGAISAAHLGSVLRDQRLSSLVLIAASTNAPAPKLSLMTVPLHEITYPVLFVHHREDDCVPFQSVHQQQYRLTKSPRVHFIEVLGGDPSRGVFCSPANPITSYTHGLSGKEPEVVQAITDWAMGKPVPERIGP